MGDKYLDEQSEVNFTATEEMLNSDKVLRMHGDANHNFDDKEVDALQDMLIAVASHNPRGMRNPSEFSSQFGASSNFGLTTLDVVRDYQESRNIDPATGNVGKITKEALRKDFEELKEEGHLRDTSKTEHQSKLSELDSVMATLKDIGVTAAPKDGVATEGMNVASVGMGASHNIG